MNLGSIHIPTAIVAVLAALGVVFVLKFLKIF